MANQSGSGVVAAKGGVIARLLPIQTEQILALDPMHYIAKMDIYAMPKVDLEALYPAMAAYPAPSEL